MVATKLMSFVKEEKNRWGVLEVSGVLLLLFFVCVCGGVWLVRCVLFCDLFVGGVMYSTLLMSEGAFFHWK